MPVVKHNFTSQVADANTNGIIKPSHWNDNHSILMEAATLMGRAAVSAGAAQDIYPLIADLTLYLDGATARLKLADSGVVAGSYTLPNLTVDAKGRVTSVENGPNITDLVQQAEAAQDGAEAAQVAAEAAQASTEAALDDFDDIYLGSKAANPTVDNDGDPLVEGQFYWNSVSNEIRFYDGAAFQAFASGLTDVVGDTTPQLGGDLDLNSNDINGTGNIDITGDIDATGDVTAVNGVFSGALTQNGTGVVLDADDIGVSVQAHSANLDEYAGVNPAANTLTLLGSADFAAWRTSLGLVIGTNVQAFDADLTTWAGLTPSANMQTLIPQTFAQMRASLDLEAGTDFYSISAANAAFQPIDSDLTSIAALATTAAGRSVLTIADPGADRIVAWDDSVGSMAAIALANITAEGAPASGDFFLAYTAEGALVKVDFDNMPGGGGDLAYRGIADITSGDTIIATDHSTFVEIVSGSGTLAFDDVATLGADFFVFIKNSGTGDVVLAPDGSEEIDGLLTWTLYPGGTILVQCDGIELRSILLSPMRKVFDSGATFVKPGCGSTVRVEAWGAGGGGACVAGNAGGGGGGSHKEAAFPISGVGATETVTIGAGGAAVSAGTGNDGGFSSFGSLMTAYGGGGANSSNGGAGANEYSSATLNTAPFPVYLLTTTYPPTNINQLFAFGASVTNAALRFASTHGGGGGSTGSLGGNGAAAVHGGGGGGSSTTTAATAGGVSQFGGNGGAGGVNGANGTAGAQPAGGGGSAENTGGAASGAGGDGRVIVTVH